MPTLTDTSINALKAALAEKTKERDREIAISSTLPDYKKLDRLRYNYHFQQGVCEQCEIMESNPKEIKAQKEKLKSIKKEYTKLKRQANAFEKWCNNEGLDCIENEITDLERDIWKHQSLLSEADEPPKQPAAKKPEATRHASTCLRTIDTIEKQERIKQLSSAELHQIIFYKCYCQELKEMASIELSVGYIINAIYIEDAIDQTNIILDQFNANPYDTLNATIRISTICEAFIREQAGKNRQPLIDALTAAKRNIKGED